MNPSPLREVGLRRPPTGAQFTAAPSSVRAPRPEELAAATTTAAEVADPVSEPVSPELALVDPELRRRLIAELSEVLPGQRLELAASDVATGKPGPPVDASTRRSSLHRAIAKLVLLPVVASLGYVAVTLITPPDGPTFGGAVVHSVDPPSAAVELRRDLAWAPVAGATAYETALYAGGHRVFLARSRKPTVEIEIRSPSSHGPASVAPGTYDWYVWPVRGGQRSVVAIVRTRLVLTGN